MRIIAGSAKGRTLKTIKGLETRPTLDRVREAVFNTLREKVIGAKMLDLFAGSGAIGIEALSRGATHCYFNDQNKKACQIIKENLRKCNFMERSRVFAMDGLKLIFYLQEQDRVKFDVIYLDPPYLSGDYATYLQKLEESGLLAENCIIIAESRKTLTLADEYQRLRLLKRRDYGDTAIWYYNFLGEE